MFRATGLFDKTLDKATSNMLLETDWEANLQLCDMIRQNDITAKYAISAVKKKMYNSNPNVSLFALRVLETIMKNCGSSVHDEVATKAVMEELRDLVRSCTNEKVREKVLELIQVWAHAFRNEQKYRAVQDTLNIMRAEGHQFPVLKESDAMFSADSAPKWAEGDCCHRCRVQFSVFRRKHHCRCCGQIFCDSCSNHFTNIPKYGIEKAVRICDSCFETQQKGSSSTSAAKPDSTSSSSDHSGGSSPQQNAAPKKSEQEIKEEDELQLALALSRSEAEAKEQEKLRNTQILLAGVGRQTVSPPPSSQPEPQEKEPEYSGDLGRYMNRAYWEKKEQENIPPSQSHSLSGSQLHSTPASQMYSMPEPSAPITAKVDERFQNGENDDIDDFLMTLKSQLEIFVNRMRSNASRGRNIAMDSSVQTLFMNVSAMHSQLLKRIQEHDQARAKYERLQEKVDDVRGAREALNALRDDHREELRREQEEQARQRQAQMQLKLQVMRQKKHEYLQYQRQLAMQRMQEQEREMAMRMEQQYMMGAYPVQGYTQHQLPLQGPGASAGFPPSSDGSHGVGYPPGGMPPYGAPVPSQPSYSQPFHMQAMASALPPTAAPPNYSVPPDQMAPPMGPIPAGQVPLPSNQMPPHQPAPPPPAPIVTEAAPVAELISFD